MSTDRAIWEGIEAAERWPSQAQKFVASQFDSIRDRLTRLPCAPITPSPGTGNCFDAVVGAATAWANLVHAEMAREAVARDARVAVETARWLGVSVPADIAACAGGSEVGAPRQMSATKEWAFDAYQLRAIEHMQVCEILGQLQDQQHQLAGLGRELAQRLDRIDCNAHQEVAEAPLRARADIIAAARADAEAVHTELVEAATDMHTKTRNAVTALVAELISPQGSLDAPEKGEGD
jgi:hypothetical protein